MDIQYQWNDFFCFFRHKFIGTNESNWNDENGTSIECICDYSSNAEHCKYNSFACEQSAQIISTISQPNAFTLPLRLSTRCFSPFFRFVVLLTVFMLSLDGLVHSEKYLRPFVCSQALVHIKWFCSKLNEHSIQRLASNSIFDYPRLLCVAFLFSHFFGQIPTLICWQQRKKNFS